MLRFIVFSISIAAATGLSSMPTSSKDLNEGFRGGGRAAEFFDQINKASLVALDESGLISRPIAVKIANGIKQVAAKEKVSDTERSADYLEYEPKLIATVGQDASRLHIGRSRQDMGATIARMSLRDGLLEEIEALLGLRGRLLELADQNKETIIPAYTHGVQAQPTTFAHYLLGWAAALARDCERLQAAYQRVNESPLGAAALGTSSFPINRARLAELLGFDGLVENSYDANHIASVDSSLEVASALAISAIQLGQFAQDIHAQYAEPAPWFVLAQGKLTGVSSIMPQKRNPAALEQLRTQSSLMLGEMQTVFLLAHNTRTGMFDYRSYNPVPSDRPLQVYGLFRQVLDGLAVDKDRALAEVNADYSTTTEIADALMRKADVPFRIGHHFASTLTNYGRSKNLKLSEIPYAEVARLYREDAKQDLPLNAEEFKETISAEYMVYGSKGTGGPQLAEVTRMLADGRMKMKSDSEWLKVRKEHLAAADFAREKAFSELAAQAATQGQIKR
jgi:argininosuccinate lyase